MEYGMRVKYEWQWNMDDSGIWDGSGIWGADSGIWNESGIWAIFHSHDLIFHCHEWYSTLNAMEIRDMSGVMSLKPCH